MEIIEKEGRILHLIKDSTSSQSDFALCSILLSVGKGISSTPAKAGRHLRVGFIYPDFGVTDDHGVVKLFNSPRCNLGYRKFGNRQANPETIVPMNEVISGGLNYSEMALLPTAVRDS